MSFNWIGFSGLWSDASNWFNTDTNSNGVPTADSIANITGEHVSNFGAAVAFHLNLNGAAILNNTGSLTVGQFIRVGTGGSGTAQLVVQSGTVLAPEIHVGLVNEGRLIVTGGSTVTGTIAVGNGAVNGSVIVGGTSAASAGTVNGPVLLNNAGSSLTFRTTSNATYAGSMSGTGSLVIDSANRLITLTGDNSAHSGAIAVQAGVLQIGNGLSTGTLGTGSVTLSAGTQLNTARSGTHTLAGAISGAGDLVATQGTTILTGANSYANTLVTGGATLQIGNGGTTGSVGSGDVSVSGTLDFNLSGSPYFVGNAISGNGGNVVFRGGALAVLSGANSYTGTTTIGVGTNLQVNSNIGTGNVLNSGLIDFNNGATTTYGGEISGTGTVAVHAGTIILTGTNTYSGPTNIQAGTLQVGDGFTTAGTLGNGAITNNGTLAFAYGNGFATRTLSNDISGSGNVRFSGNVDFILTGNNTYSGPTLIENNAQLIVGNGGTTGNLGSGAITNNAQLAFNHAAGHYFHNGAISGTGELEVRGSGNEYLTGSNSYSGLTFVRSGTLVVGAGGTSGTLGTGNVILSSGALLDLYRSDTQLIANNILGNTAGDGTLRVFQAHTAILTGTNNYGATQITAGTTLRIGNGGSTGTLGTGAVSNEGFLVFYHSAGNYVHGNAIGGTGILNVSGSGTEIFTAVNAYTGETDVFDTTLALQGAGSIAGSSLLTLSGTGRFDIGSISGASTSVPDLIMLDAISKILLGGKTLIVSRANSYVGPGSFVGSGGTDAVVFNVASPNFTLAGTDGAVFNGWTDGVDSIVINGTGAANILTGDELRATTINGGAGNDRIVIGNGAGNYNGGADSDTLAVGSTMTLTGSLAQFEALELTGGATLSLSSAQFAGGFAINSALSGTGTIAIAMAPGGPAVLARAMAVQPGAVIVLNITGSSGTDIVKGSLGAPNVINGNAGLNQLVGGNQVDTINGGADIDKIRGDAGGDTLSGGLGNDVFKYRAVTDSTVAAPDTITDFTSGADRLNFGRIDTDPATAGDQAFTYVGTAAFAGGGVASIRWVDLGSDLRVEADVNGDGVADMHVLLQGAGAQTLSVADFVL